MIFGCAVKAISSPAVHSLCIGPKRPGTCPIWNYKRTKHIFESWVRLRQKFLLSMTFCQKTEQIQRMTAIFTPNTNFFHPGPGPFWVKIAVVNLLSSAKRSQSYLSELKYESILQKNYTIMERTNLIWGIIAPSSTFSFPANTINVSFNFWNIFFQLLKTIMYQRYLRQNNQLKTSTYTLTQHYH